MRSYIVLAMVGVQQVERGQCTSIDAGAWPCGCHVPEMQGSQVPQFRICNSLFYINNDPVAANSVDDITTF